MSVQQSAQNIADVLRGIVSDATDPVTVDRFMKAVTAVVSIMGIETPVASGISAAQTAMAMRGYVLSQFDQMTVCAAIAAANGYLLPENPLGRLNTLNSSRQLFGSLGISDSEAATIEQSTLELSRVTVRFSEGIVTFSRSQPASQISSFEVSVDGIAQQTGDALTDILGYQPDADFVKRKRSLDALAKLDFSKRKPSMLFTANVIKGGKRADGTILGWQRMHDAVGYSIAPRDVFATLDLPDVVVSNEELLRSTADIAADPNFAQIMSFYDWVGPNGFYAWVDTTIHSDTLYSYEISGLQRRVSSTPFVFDVPVSALYLSAAQADRVKAAILDDLQIFSGGSDVDTVSPYPAISTVIYGDPGYGWILAGCNVIASRKRSDQSDETRKLSYIGSKASDVLAAAASGKLVVPNDLTVIHAAIENGISSFGVSQTILNVLDGTGVTLFVSGKDDPLGGQPTSDALDSATGGLSKILSAIDPQSATIDPHTLVASLMSQVSGGTGKSFAFNSRPLLASFIALTSPKPSIASTIGDGVIDLTTYVGIARMMQLIRSVYDFYPSALT